jgi:hypothetical protein
MTDETRRHLRGIDWFSVISIGFFLLLLGAIWILTPNMTQEANNFVQDFELQNVTQNIAFPAPKNNHPVLYTAAMEFCLTFAAFQVVILALRFYYREPMGRKTETISGVVFWFSTGIFLYLLAIASIGWYGFLAGLLISIGLAVITRSAARLIRTSRVRQTTL